MTIKNETVIYCDLCERRIDKDIQRYVYKLDIDICLMCQGIIHKINYHDIGKIDPSSARIVLQKEVNFIK